MSLTKVSYLFLQVKSHKHIHDALRFYSRWSHRKPAKVLLPFEFETKPNVDLKKEKVISLDPRILKKTQGKPDVTQSHEKSDFESVSIKKTAESSLSPEKSKEIKTKKEEKLKKRQFYLKQLKVFDDNNEIIYEKMKDNDGRVSTLLTNVKSKKERLRTCQVMVEGWRLIVDGLEAGCSLNYIVFSRVEDLNNIRPFLPKTGVKFYKIPYKEIELWSNVETSPGIFGIFEMPSHENVKRLSKPLPLQFICDNIRVPGNLGAILRAAVGVGCDKVILSKGCVDVWEPKVLRSAAGAHFRLPIHHAIDWEEMPKYLEDTSVFIADSNAKVLEEHYGDDSTFESMQIPVVPYYGVEYSAHKYITLVIGGETEGISEDSYQLAANTNGLRLNIPLQKGVDSLNTGMATAIIAFEIRKQLIQAWTKIKMDRQIAGAI